MKKVIFENLFNESNGQPFMYNDKEIKMSDRIGLPSNESSLKITFVSTDSKWKQGVVLQTKGEFKINSQKVLNKVVLWEHTAPKEIQVDIKSKDKLLIVYNVWDIGDGAMHYGHNGAAMHVEEKDRCKIYNCNDGFPDDDFNDLIFTIEL